MHVVAVLLLEPLIGFDATIAPMCFGKATDDDGRPLYEVVTCSVDGGPVMTTNGYAIAPQSDASVLARADTVIVPGNRQPQIRMEGVLPETVRDALSLIRPGTRLVSICTGAFTLAAAGALDGRRVTTHWQAGGDLARLHPAVDLVEHVLFVDDGDVLTSAGVASGLDLCLYIIRGDHGTAVANRVARYAVIPPAREGMQAQFVDRPVPSSGAGSTAATRAWATANPSDNLSVERLARRADMSPRTFNRRFREETGETPGAWVQRLRLDHARELLERTDLSIDDVAERSGLGSGASLRTLLRRDTGMPPSTYRRLFQTPTAAG
ncbi:GlxA family transcriptional regulator [Gordonia neofelifaecis]|uniref:Transcriptional regulator, AraC family protein n=1 Tax=Gordonia neofelifaecis NRRL B-59395 TaxID=644548 RepID=F1YP86_9ACTN|nr:helix-turn-helix domain-containing protein [Gordonia neofelifaecis]EGD53481.1 transcriptional regulator, AraC family protein [Gordonia neofelifaecis NRRL B-59395]